jgi:hypothetical protein
MPRRVVAVFLDEVEMADVAAQLLEVGCGGDLVVAAGSARSGSGIEAAALISMATLMSRPGRAWDAPVGGVALAQRGVAGHPA